MTTGRIVIAWTGWGTIRRPLFVSVALILAALCLGCAKQAEEPSTAAAQTSQNTSADSSPVAQAAESSATPVASVAKPAAIAVGDDPAASLQQVAAAARQAFEGYSKLEKLIYPRGWYRYQPAVLEAIARLEEAPASQTRTGVVELTVQDRNTLIRPTQAEAAADAELFPRTPAPTPEEMLNNFSNAELKPTVIVIQYREQNGAWQRVDWQGKPRGQRGADWLDRVGVP